MKTKVNVKYGWITFAVTLVITLVVGYLIFLPALNVHSIGMWIFLGLCLGFSWLLGLAVDVTLGEQEATRVGKKYDRKVEYDLPKNSVSVVGIALVGAVFLFVIVGGICSSRMVASKVFSSRLQVTESDFETEIPRVEDVSNIALMDTETAITIGKRAVGSLTEMVSQYYVSEEYTTIDYNGMPMKVAPLEYDGMFKYFNNADEGIPGYVMVNPVTNTAEYVACEEPIRYAPSGLFGNDLLRHLRSEYPFDVFEGMYFEIDEEGHPYWICPAYSYKLLFGARMIGKVVVMDACSGEMVAYSIGEVPNWIDRVYDGDLLCEAYDDYGFYRNGFWNTIFGKKGCQVTTEDYGYKVMGGDVWVYTGVTSVVNDESNIGFVLMNQRTAETVYIPVAGAEEFSAMQAAEGEAQDLGYVASFPSLINVDGIPSYICVLKDNGGLVKMYALVNVEQYNIVGTGSTSTEALKAYRNALKNNNIDVDDAVVEETETVDIVVEKVVYGVIEGETYVYLIGDNGQAYKTKLSEQEGIVLVLDGDEVTVTCQKTPEADQVYTLVSFEKK